MNLEAFELVILRRPSQTPTYDEGTLGVSLRAHMEWAVGEVLSYSPPESRVATGLPIPRWGWNGPE